MPWFVFCHFGRNWRTRTHDGHVALDDVEKLREFVEAELAENVTERIDAGVVLHLERLSARLVEGHQFFLAFFGVHVHAAELVHGKQLAVLAYAGLLENDGTLGVANLDGERAEQKQGRRQYDCKACAGDVHNSFDDVTEADGMRMFPDMVEVQARKGKEASVGAVEFLDLVGQFQIVLFLKSGVDVGFENRTLRFDAERLDEARVVQLVQNFLSNRFQRGKVGIEQDKPDTATIGKESEDVDKAQVRKHGEDTDFPGVLDGLVRTAPAEKVVLVGIHLDIEEGLAGSVRS